MIINSQKFKLFKVFIFFFLQLIFTKKIFLKVKKQEIKKKKEIRNGCINARKSLFAEVGCLAR